MSHLNKIGRELVLDILNQTNRTNITFAQVEFSAPTMISGAAEGARNTRITISSKPNAPFTGSVSVTYWRLNISKVLSEAYLQIPIRNVTDTTGLIAQINQMYQIQLSEEDVAYEAIDTSTLPMTYRLRIVNNSYAYYGYVDLELIQGIPDISEPISINLLDGLNYPDTPVMMTGVFKWVNESGMVLAGTGIPGSYMTSMANGELEVFIGAHRRGSGNAMVTPVDGTYSFSLADNRQWNWTFGVGLLSEDRGSDLTALYDVEMYVQHMAGGKVSFVLTKHLGALVWAIPGFGPAIIDSVNVEDVATQNSQQTLWYSAGFQNLQSNSAGAHLGVFNINIKATPKNAVYVKPIDLTIVVQVAPE